MNRKIRQPGVILVIILLSYALVFPLPSSAQDKSLEISLDRNWGYGGFGEIQGLFTIKASGVDDLDYVTFTIDENIMAQVTESPYKFTFSTDDYPLGVHTLQATGVTKDGNFLNSNQITIKFVSAETGWKTAMRMIVPVLVIVVVAFLVSTVVTFASGKKRLNPAPGTERKYGSVGGAICPKCHRPTPLHWMGINLGMWKFDRCENCLKWSAMKKQPMDVLRKAEADELTQVRKTEAGFQEILSSEEEKLKKQIEDSRYQDLNK